jgi:hypothetical protein
MGSFSYAPVHRASGGAGVSVYQPGEARGGATLGVRAISCAKPVNLLSAIQSSYPGCVVRRVPVLPAPLHAGEWERICRSHSLSYGLRREDLLDPSRIRARCIICPLSCLPFCLLHRHEIRVVARVAMLRLQSSLLPTEHDLRKNSAPWCLRRAQPLVLA